MCCFFKRFIKQTTQSKRHNPIIWIAFIALLLLIDICISQNGSIILMQKPDTSQTVSWESPVLGGGHVNLTGIPEVKESIGKNSPILNVTSSGDILSDSLIRGVGYIAHINYIKYFEAASLYITLAMFTGRIVFFLEKILLFIQNNDGKKREGFLQSIDLAI